MATTRELKIKVDQTGNAESGLSSIIDKLKTVGGIAGGVALSGVLALGAGITGVGYAGLSMNNSMEKARARINAFTKDGKKTADILSMIRDRAAKTPFEFQQMADAAAALLPSSKQAQVGLEDLIEQAEILAASNPAEGLEGAAFALKEAVSGDFTSIIERFNLPRSFINKLKDEGVPALEIVSRAMKELGLDADLVGAMAETAEGRWSTFKDTLQGLAARITQPVFDTFSGGLGKLNEKLEAAGPALDILAGKLAEGIQVGLDFSGQMFTNLTGWVSRVTAAYQEGGVSGIAEIVRADLALLGNSINTEVQKYEQQFWAWLDDVRAKAPANFALLQNTIRTQIIFAWPGIQESLTTWGTRFWDWTLSAITGTNISMANLTGSIDQWITAHQADIENFGKTIGGYVYTGLTGTFADAKQSDSAIQTLVTSLAQSIVNIYSSLVTAGVNLASGMLQGVIEEWSGQKASARLSGAIRGEIIGVVTSLNPLAWFTPVGRSSIDGIIQGFRNGWGALERAAREAAQHAFDAAMGFLRAGSPSELFSDEVGEEAIGGGIAQGIGRAAGAVKSATRQALSPAVMAAGGGGLAPATAGAGAGGSPIVVNFTYSPVISTADRYEAENVLAPFIANGIRDHLSGKR